MCKVTVLGRLGKDAEISQTSNGTSFVKFTVAENEYRGGEDKTTWFDVVSYDPFVINSQIKALKKGVFVVVDGRLDGKINVAKSGTVYLNYGITAWNISIPNLGNGKSDNNNVASETPTVTINLDGLNTNTSKQDSVLVVAQNDSSANNNDGDDELPF